MHPKYEVAFSVDLAASFSIVSYCSGSLKPGNLYLEFSAGDLVCGRDALIVWVMNFSSFVSSAVTAQHLVLDFHTYSKNYIEVVAIKLTGKTKRSFGRCTYC